VLRRQALVNQLDRVVRRYAEGNGNIAAQLGESGHKLDVTIGGFQYRLGGRWVDLNGQAVVKTVKAALHIFGAIFLLLFAYFC
jgi:hypothetical protein